MTRLRAVTLAVVFALACSPVPHSADLDKAIDAGRSPQLPTGCDQPARTQHYETFNQLLNVQQPYLFAFTPDTLLASPPTLRGLAVGTFWLHAGIHLWWLHE